MSFIIQCLPSYQRQKYIVFQGQRQAICGSVVESLMVEGEKWTREEILNVLGFQEQDLLEILQNQDSWRLKFYLDKLQKQFWWILEITINFKVNKIIYKFLLLNHDLKFVKITSKQRKILLNKEIHNLSHTKNLDCYKVNLNFINGLVNIASLPFSYSIQIPSSNIKGVFTKLFQLYYQSLQLLKPILMNMIACSNQAPQFTHKYIRQKTNHQKNIEPYKYLKQSSIFLNIQDYGNQEDYNKRQMKQSKSLKQVINEYSKVQKQFNLIKFYTLNDPSELADEILPQQKFQPNKQFKNMVKMKLSLPMIKESNNKMQDFYILNHIKLTEDIKPQKLVLINSGGFSNIFSCQVTYTYTRSYDQTKDDLPLQEHGNLSLTKNLIIKRDKVPQKMISSKTQHEKFIIRKLKNGTCMYVPKYYQVFEKSNAYHDDLIMDHINYPDLRDYLYYTQETLSYHTKIFLCSIIAQAIRYLGSYQVVHLDLKPRNIMLCRYMNIKIIDFGQSYHPELAANHSPSCSFPYSAPQNHSYEPRMFDLKSDVFSLGCIMYELFFSKYPFYIHDLSLRNKFTKEACFEKLWYFNPQGNELYGQAMTFPILQMLICKCLSFKEENRPELEWIILILIESLRNLY